MTCALEIRDQKSSVARRAPCAPLLVGLGAALAVSAGCTNGDPFALICDALTAVVSAALNLVFACSELLARFEIYPEALRPAAAVTPYPVLLYAPGGLAIDAEPAFLWRGTLALAAWALSATLCAEIAVRRARRAPD
ncbi:MAG: hypothetical protein ABUL62_04585 [Myxococcales bacterium]|jgi:hypothetical protein